jgi:hypothetical protein
MRFRRIIHSPFRTQDARMGRALRVAGGCREICDAAFTRSGSLGTAACGHFCTLSVLVRLADDRSGVSAFAR